MVTAIKYAQLSLKTLDYIFTFSPHTVKVWGFGGIMKSIVFGVVDHDYIDPLRVALKTFRSKNSIPFKVFKIDDFKVPDDLKNLPNVEFIDFKPEKALKFVK